MSKHNILSRSKLHKAQKAIKKGKLTDAAKILTLLSKQDPSDVATLLLLASVYGGMKNYQAVAEYSQKVLLLEPNNSTAMNFLGDAYSATRQYDKAIDYYKKTLTLKPNNISVLHNLAKLCDRQNHIDEALVAYHKIIDLKADHIDALISIIQICTKQGYFRVAIKHCLSLYKLQPNNHEILIILGQCYSGIREIDKAREAFIKCARLSYKVAECYTALAKNEQHSKKSNHLEEAEKYLNSALEANPTYLNARVAQCDNWYRQRNLQKAHAGIKELINDGYINANILVIYASLCHQFDECDYVLTEGEKLLEQSNKLHVDDSAALHYNLGRLYDKNKQYNQAFKHYQFANNSENVIYRQNLNEEYTANIIDTYTPDNLKNLQYASLKSERPVFIVGMPRSGTTLVEQILASHKDIHGAGELPDMSEIYTSFIPTEFDYVEEYPAYINKLTTEQLNITAQHYLDKLESHSPTALRVTDKMPQNFLQLGLIAQLFPQARIIHCHRHPLDTILSIYFQDFSKGHNYSFKLENIYHYYQQYQALMAHWKKTLKLNILDVSYSNMVDDFENTCRGLIEFVGLNWDKQCLDFHKSKRAAMTASYDQIRSPIYKSSINRWKNYEEFLDPLKSICPELFK